MGKLTFALIDDEIYAIRHLNRLICNVSPDYRILSTYTDADEALKQLPSSIPDVVFVDIIMPGISGLEFAEKFHVLCPDTQIIILTAYRDFEYAKKSLTIGVCDYWLKNELRPATMKEKLQKVEKEVENVRLNRRRRGKEQIKRCLTCESPLREAFPPVLGQECRYFLMVYQDNQAQKAIPEIPLLQPRLNKLQIEITDFIFNVFPGDANAFSIGRLVSGNSVGIDRIWKKFYIELGNETGRFSKGRVIVNGYFPDEEYQNHYLYDTNQIIANLHRDPQKPLVFLDDNIRRYFTQGGELYRYFEENYFSKMKQALDEKNQDLFFGLYNELAKSSYLAAGNQAAIDYTVSRLTEIGAGITESSKLCEAEEFPRQLQEDANSQPIGITLKKAREMFEQIICFNMNNDSVSERICPIMNYIRKNYDHDLNVSALAKEFNISGDYLRKLFRIKTGVGLTDYITKVRIDAAENLLKTGRYRVYEISELVGYHSASYFSQAYRKYKGYYPTDSKLQGKKA
jgi:two-component system, response regulator YesN